MRPHLSLGAKPPDGAIEHFDHQLRRDHLILDLADGDQVDLRFLDLNDWAAGIGKLMIFLVESLGDCEHAGGRALVVPVLHREANFTGRVVNRCAAFHIAVYCK
jgi:hypothetical protein